MKYASLCMAVAVTLVGATAYASLDNPLEAYEQLSPATIMDAPAPEPGRAAAYDKKQIGHGKYMVEILGCGTCHTDGALIGEPVPERKLAGSSIGIAYSSPLKQEHPGVVYPANLTPDEETGLGKWRDEEIVEMIRHGIDRHGHRKLSVMPWPAYTRLTDDDARAIVAYLRSLAPVRHRVPDNVRPGQKTDYPYIHFGVYRSRR